MKKQIEEIFKGMTIDELQELKIILQELYKDAQSNLKKTLDGCYKKKLSDSDLKNKEVVIENFLPLFSVFGVGEIIKILHDEQIKRIYHL